MQELPTDVPQAPPSRASHDFKSSPIYGKMPITYKAGMLVGPAYRMYLDGRLRSDEIDASFNHYVKGEGKQKLETFDAYLLAVCYGAFSNGKERGEINYSTNYVLDTRADIMRCSYFMPTASGDGYEIRTLASGLYKTHIAPALRGENRTNFYTRALIAYIPQLDEVRAIHLSKVAEAGFLRAIAQAQRVPEHKASFFGLSDLENQIWAFRFEGKFEPVVFAPEGAKNTAPTLPADPKSQKVFFQPVIKAAVFGPNTRAWEKTFEKVAELRDLWFGYLSSEQAYFAAPQQSGEAQEPQSQSQPQRATAPPINSAPGASEWERLPDLNDYEDATPDSADDLPF